jgi:phenylpropionate dioxygenase-like ring-hydroxylating dioxygenase large terminal subunit
MSTPLQRAPEPDLDYVPIPKERYTSKEYAGLEWQHMWTRTWLMAGRESDLRRPGDYFTFEIGPESILVIKQNDDSIAARYNVCMHRGNRLREPGRGHVKLFSCLFHGWQYDINGTLTCALDEETFPQGVDKAERSLRPVRCETWAGFVFVNLNPDAEPLLDFLGVIPEHLGPYHFENWKIDYDCTVEIECNWKTSVDAFNEAYHVSATHAWTLEFSDDTRTVIDCYPRHTRLIFPEVQASLRHPGANTVTRGIRESFLKRIGIEDFDGDAPGARKAFAARTREIAPSLGADVSDLDDMQLCDDFHYTVFPNITFNTHALFVWVFTHRPHPTDPNKMYFDFINLVNAGGRDVPRPKKELYSTANGDTLAGKFSAGGLIDEDLYNLTRVQAGMHSRAFESLLLGKQEVRILHHQKTLEELIARGQARQAASGSTRAS